MSRAHADATEHDHHSLRFDGSLEDSLHELFCSAGGETICQETDRDVVYMAKTLDMSRFFAGASKELLARAKAAGLPRPLTLGFQVAKSSGWLTLSAQRAQYGAGGHTRHYLHLRCMPDQLTQFLLGHRSVSDAIATGCATTSTSLARKFGCALFFPCHLCQPPWDYLPASDF